jgi:hypothetical protein
MIVNEVKTTTCRATEIHCPVFEARIDSYVRSGLDSTAPRSILGGILPVALKSRGSPCSGILRAKPDRLEAHIMPIVRIGEERSMRAITHSE